MFHPLKIEFRNVSSRNHLQCISIISLSIAVSTLPSRFVSSRLISALLVSSLASRVFPTFLSALARRSSYSPYVSKTGVCVFARALNQLILPRTHTRIFIDWKTLSICTSNKRRS